MAVPTYEIYVRDNNLNKVEAINVYQQLRLEMNYLMPGAWGIDISDDGNRGAEALKGVFGSGMLPGIIVVRDGEVIFSGPVQGFEATGDYYDTQEGENITFFGTDDTGLLASRVAAADTFPTTSSYALPVGDGYLVDEIVNNIAETALRSLVEKNCINEPTRIIPFLSLEPNQTRGGQVTVTSRYQKLLQKTKEVALAGGVGYRILQTGIGELKFQVYTPLDLKSSVKFSKGLGNLASYQYKRTAPNGNVIIVGGSGENENRYFETVYSSETLGIYGQWEMFNDQRNSEQVAELINAGFAEIEENDELVEVTAEVINIPPTLFFEDYNLGDEVVIRIGNDAIRDIVRSVEIVLDRESGETITPKIGTDAIGCEFNIFNRIKNLNNRVNQLEVVY